MSTTFFYHIFRQFTGMILSLLLSFLTKIDFDCCCILYSLHYFLSFLLSFFFQICRALFPYVSRMSSRFVDRLASPCSALISIRIPLAFSPPVFVISHLYSKIYTLLGSPINPLTDPPTYLKRSLFSLLK